MRLLYKLAALLLLLFLAQLAGSCARRPAWPGFSHPAYLPARPVARGPYSPLDTLRRPGLPRK